MSSLELTLDSLVDVRLQPRHVLGEVEEQTDGSQHHTKVGMLQAIIQNILHDREVINGTDIYSYYRQVHPSCMYHMVHVFSQVSVIRM